jgi:hypothetical protein
MQLASPLGTAIVYNAGGEELWDGELKGPTSPDNIYFCSGKILPHR